MNKQFYLAWLSYVVLTFALGFVWHLVLFPELYLELEIYTRILDPIIPMGLSAIALQGLILAYLYPFYADLEHPIKSGLKFGWVIGVFMASVAVIAEAAKNYVNSIPTWLIVETTYYLLQFSLVGLAFGWIHGKRCAEAPSPVSFSP